MGHAFETDGNTERWFPNLRFPPSITDLFNEKDSEAFASIYDHASKRFGNSCEVRVIPDDLATLSEVLSTTEVVKCADSKSLTLFIYDVKGQSGSTSKNRLRRPFKYPPTYEDKHFEKVMESIWGRYELELNVRSMMRIFGKGDGEL